MFLKITDELNIVRRINVSQISEYTVDGKFIKATMQSGTIIRFAGDVDTLDLACEAWDESHLQLLKEKYTAAKASIENLRDLVDKEFN